MPLSNTPVYKARFIVCLFFFGVSSHVVPWRSNKCCVSFLILGTRLPTAHCPLPPLIFLFVPVVHPWQRISFGLTLCIMGLSFHAIVLWATSSVSWFNSNNSLPTAFFSFSRLILISSTFHLLFTSSLLAVSDGFSILWLFARHSLQEVFIFVHLRKPAQAPGLLEHYGN